MKKVILTLVVAVLATSVMAQSDCGELLDANQDGLIGVEDLMNLLSHFGDSDVDFDGVFDSVDDCVGEYDECGVCNGPGAVFDCGCESIPADMCNCDSYDSDEDGICDDADPCVGFIDALGECNGDCEADYDNDGVCDNYYGPCNGMETILFFGDEYELVEIGEQCWFADNLRTDTYLNGDSITGNLTNSEWASASEGAQAIAFNDSSYLEGYGRLYNRLAVIDERGICPIGWHVPSIDEFWTLTNFLGGQGEAGGHLRANPDDNPGWHGPNLSGFSALPGGRTWFNGAFHSLSNQFLISPFWSTTYYHSNAGWWFFVYPDEDNVIIEDQYNREGTYVRCLKDAE